MKDNEEVLCPTCRNKLLGRMQSDNYHSKDKTLFILMQSLMRDMEQMRLIIESKASEEEVLY